ncbi:hypothetical protein ZWY2020_024293 [Hordeum vulgare]|nr:hypothetical protein ZWY2020_024293 [Hordeum vulgare]
MARRPVSPPSVVSPFHVTPPVVASALQIWTQPPSSKKEFWRRRHGVGESAAQGAPHARQWKDVSSKMEGLYFRCFGEGHFRRDCANPWCVSAAATRDTVPSNANNLAPVPKRRASALGGGSSGWPGQGVGKSPCGQGSCPVTFAASASAAVEEFPRLCIPCLECAGMKNSLLLSSASSGTLFHGVPGGKTAICDAGLRGWCST